MREFDSDHNYEECPVCGSVAFIKEEVQEPRTHIQLEQSIEFYSCSVCGHTRQREVVDTARGAQVVESFDVDFVPLLSRRAEFDGRQVPREVPEDRWMYFLGDDEVDEPTWRHELEERKRAMKGILN